MANMQGSKTALFVAVAVMVLFVLCSAYDGEENIGTVSQSILTVVPVLPVPPGCPGGKPNGLKNGWLLRFINACPANTIKVAVKYQVKGQWRSVGYWALPPGGNVDVALTDNKAFEYYAITLGKYEGVANWQCLQALAGEALLRPMWQRQRLWPESLY